MTYVIRTQWGKYVAQSEDMYTKYAQLAHNYPSRETAEDARESSDEFVEEMRT